MREPMRRAWRLSLAFAAAVSLGPAACSGPRASGDLAKPAGAPVATSAPVGAAKDATPGSVRAAAAEATGPAAPELRAVDWVGNAPALAARPRLVAAWTTWCPGCRAETAFLSALSKRYAGKVDVFALSDETADKVTSFANALKAPIRLEFPVALAREPAGGGPPVLKAYFSAVGMRSAILPHAFLVSANKIVWHGAAGDATAALDEVLATGDAARARNAEAELATLKTRYRADHAAGGRAGARSSAAALLAAARGHASFLNSMAWDMVDGDTGADLVFALELARAGVEASNEAEYTHLDTLGLALWKNGRKAEALAVQKKAVALCDALAASCPEEKARLVELQGR